MLFNSYIFLFLFLPVVLIGWYGLNKFSGRKTALIFLTGMSLWFYGYYNVWYLILIIASILGNFILSLILKHARDNGDISGHRYKLASGFTLFGGIALNLGLLFYFKYYDFFIENINAVFGSDLTLKHIILPLGISFFTFQQLSYIVDRALGRAEHSGLIEYSAFVTFFPQLIAGPIVLHSELIPQLTDDKKPLFDADMFYDGVISFVIGLSKKVLLADLLAVIVNYGFDNSRFLDTFSTIAVMTAYFLELYFDFSGYSDMAIGLGLMFGIELPDNFNSPYKAATLKELWTRWHMTLTRFMRTYVYIPLGGSKKGRVRTLVNVFIVFVVSGLWHGAAWTYVVWGICTGLIVIWDNINPIKLPRKLGIVITDITFTLLLIPFRSTSLSQAGQMFKNLTKGWTGNLLKIAPKVLENVPELYLPKRLLTAVLGEGRMGIVFLVEMLFIIAIGLFVISRKNAKEIRHGYRDAGFLPAALTVLFVYCVISLSQVSTFIYFNF